jgi:diaminopimelate decarboxylase
LDRHERTRAAYASKAFLTGAMACIVRRENLWLDVVSGGELHTALLSNFPMERVLFHGSAKSKPELTYAVKLGAGRVVVDNMTEMERLSDIAQSEGVLQKILIRVSPGVDSHTHKYIQTGGLDSKFGIPLRGNGLIEAIRFVMNSASLELEGFHFHIGSQLKDPESHVLAAKALVSRVGELRTDAGYSPREINVGGGFAAAFSPSEESAEIGTFLDPVMKTFDEYFEAEGIARPIVCIEPGRWIVSEAGITLYRVENVKDMPGTATYVAVDGGMADNPRPSLYGAEYCAFVANKMDEPAGAPVTIVGRCCESGDVIVRDARLPMCEREDIIAVLSTGAYNYSMASRYNMLPRPAVLLISNGIADTIVRGETWDDLARYDFIPERLRASGQGAF